MPKHPDYDDDEELHYGTPVQWYIMYRDGEPEALLAYEFGVNTRPHDLPDNVESYRIPKKVYELHAAFETYPVRTADYYTDEVVKQPPLQ